MKLFLYGTLADPIGLGRCAGRPLAAPPAPATLAGFQRVMLRRTRFPTLRRAPGQVVHGVVARVTADMMTRLQNYESSRYRQILVRLTTQAGTIRARCFYGDAPTKIGWRPDPKLMSLRSRSY
jgi:gamma-glutamylcyclotransferase (GGCT)/AIG2-like uncharacterized protein YtfP